MRSPAHWYAAPGFVARALSPIGWLYAKATEVRLARGERKKIGIPVLCIGNLVAGGTGKTPTAIALAQRLKERGKTPAFVSRGYGGTLAGPHLVAERTDSAEKVGDEPLLLSAFALTWVSKDRLAGALAARDAGAEVIILDDGFQNPALHYDLSIVVADAEKGFGNGFCIPAGPLREPAKVGLKRADILLTIGNDDQQSAFEKTNELLDQVNRVAGKLEPLATGMDWAGLRVLAFAGIGHPEKFFATLRAVGANVLESLSLADHGIVDRRMFQRLLRRAGDLNARLVCTEKDAVKLSKANRKEVLTLPVRLSVDDWRPIDLHFDRLGL